MEFAAREGGELEGPRELESRAAIERDVENLRGALRWAIDAGDADLALTEVEALATAGALRTPPFGLIALEAAQMPGAEGHDLRPMALGAVCMTYTQQGEVERAVSFAHAALEAAREWGDSPRTRKLRCRLNGCVFAALAYGSDTDRILTLGRAALEDASAIDDPVEKLRALVLLSSMLDAAHSDEAIGYGEEALAQAKAIGNPSYLAWAPMMLGGRLATTDPARARRLLDEAARAAAAADNEFARSMAMQQLAMTQARQADHFAAAQTLLEMVRHAHRAGDHGTVMSGLADVACLLAVLGVDEPALVTGEWVMDHGIVITDALASNDLWAQFGIVAFLASREGAPRGARERSADLARSFDEAAIIDYVEAQLGAHGPS